MRGFGYGFDVGMLLEGLAQGFAEDAHAAAVDDADARESGEESAVDEFFDFARGVVDGVADDVDLRGRGLRFVFEGDGDSALAGGLHRRICGAS